VRRIREMQEISIKNLAKQNKVKPCPIRGWGCIQWSRIEHYGITALDSFKIFKIHYKADWYVYLFVLFVLCSISIDIYILMTSDDDDNIINDE
jgi:hypothetical protein